MTREEIKQEYNKLKGSFDDIKKDIEKKIVNTKHSKCEYFEIFPYSYQRHSFKQGELLENLNSLGGAENLYSYGFDSKERIIQIKEGISLENQFYYEFLIYDENKIKSLSYDNSKALRNLSYFFLNELGKVSKMIFQGKHGAKEENYLYKEGVLMEIHTNPYEGRRQRQNLNPYKEIFEYTEAGELKQITKFFENGYSETIYEF